MYDVVCDAVDREYKLDCALEDEDGEPPYEVIDIVINVNGESYPVVSEVHDVNKLREEGYEKILVLPDALYSLTPECKIWMELREAGIIGSDAPFDYAKYHAIAKQQLSRRN